MSGRFVWRNHLQMSADASDYFTQKFIHVCLPLIIVLVSLCLVLPLYISERRLHSPGHVTLTSNDVLLVNRTHARSHDDLDSEFEEPEHSKSSNAYDLAVDDDYLHRSRLPPGTMETIPMRDRGRRERETTERCCMAILIIAHVVGIFLSSDSWIAGSSVVSVVYWSYLLTISLHRNSTLSYEYSFRVAANLAYCYFLRWVIAMVDFRSILISELYSPLSTILTVIDLFMCTILLTVALLSPLGTFPAYVEVHRGLMFSPPRYATLISIFTFSFIEPMLKAGFRRPLTMNDVWDMAKDWRASYLSDEFRPLRRKMTFLRALVYYHRNRLIWSTVHAIVQAPFAIVPTILVKRILEHLEQPESSPEHVARLYVVLLFATAIVGPCLKSLAIRGFRKVSTKTRSIIITEIYAKALKRKGDMARSESKKSSRPMLTRSSSLARVVRLASPRPSADSPRMNMGAIINLMAIDANEVALAISDFTDLINCVVNMLLSIMLVFRFLGPSAFGSILMMVTLVPVNYMLSRLVSANRQKLMKLADERTQKTNEVLQSFKIIKYFAWESVFRDTLMAIRAREISGLIYHFTLYTAGSIIWYGTPLLLAVVTFGAYTLIAGHELKASVAFSCLSVINIVRKPIERLATSITDIMSAKVSLDRIQTFLEEEPTGKYRVLSVPRGPESPYIGFENASFTWGPRTDVGKFALWDLSIDFPVGKLTVVIGPTGSGKSSLLMALLGEMTLIEGNVFLPGLSTTSGIPSPLAGYTDTVAYCAQRPWLLNDSIRNNIVFGSAFDEARYFRVITACCLLPIFDSLEHSDLTIVGDKGITLSGGQKQRISLARAVYSSARHLLLDGCLGSIDAHSARTIFENCLSGPLMFGRTCILVSHNYTLTIPSASLVVALREGRVDFVGSPAEALEQGVLGSDRNLVKSSSLSTRSATPIEEAVAVEEEEEEGQAAAVRHNRFAVRRDSETLVRAESRKVGNVGLRTYLTYFSYVGSGKYVVFLLSVFVMQQVGDFGQNLWIRRWSQSAEIEREKERHDTGHYIRIYVLISLVYLLVSGARDGLAFHRSLNVSRRLFADLLDSVMYAIPRFFHTTPIGVIINRFSKDIETIDSILMPTLISITHSVISILIILCVITVILPRFLFLLGFICGVFFVINRHFESTSVELRRMRLVTRSPLYQHFSETLSGLATIRAYGHESRFMLELMEKLDVHTRPYNAIWGCDRWMKFRCEVVGGLITAIAAGFIIWKGELIDAGLAGLCLTYAANFTGEISDLMAVNAMNETNMNSVERVEEFLEIEQEAPAVVESNRPPAGWPSAGAVVVSNLSLRYAAHLPRVVDGINFEVKGGWKVGIVGRTGAGKSTIASAFFRFLEAEEGRIVIDGIDVRGIGLRDLRQALSIIPQGTIRSNLDPNDQYSDEEIERVLERVKLMKRSDEGEMEGRIAGLSTVVSESGSNLSQGQRQLVCLARSLLKKTKVMFLDEATASIDYATDEILQRTIRREFRQTTIFTIAHRLRSVIDYDRILVLETGRVAEYGSPVELIGSKGGVFRRMCESSGAMELLEEMARGRSGDVM